MAWNISAAIQYLVKHAAPTSCHQCAKYVRLAIEAGGLSTAGRPISACKYVDFLPKIGFNHIGSIKGKANQANWTKRSARPGDIAVMDHGEHGHICMYSGRQWISDFKQNNMWVYGGDGVCHIFRYNGEIDGSLSQIFDFGGTGLHYIVPLENQKDHIALKNLAIARKNLILEILESLGDFDCELNFDIEYENEITQDESSVSEAIVETGMFWSSDMYGVYGDASEFIGGGASPNAIPLWQFNNINVDAFRRYASGGYLNNIKNNLKARTLNLKNIPLHFLNTVKKVSQQTGVPVGFFVLVGASESGFVDCKTNSIGYGGYFGQSTKNGVGYGASLEKQATEVAKTFKKVKAASPGAGYHELLVLGYIYHHLPAVGSKYWKQTGGKIFSLNPDYIYNNIKACYSGGSATRYAEAIMANVVAQYLAAQIVSNNIY